jgi:hypothetical protein
MMSIKYLFRMALQKSALAPILMLVSPFVLSEASSTQNKVETLSEVSIIGSTELPNVSFDLPWKLPTIERRDEAKPPNNLKGILEAIEPVRHRQQIHFSRFLEVDSPSLERR